MKIGIIGAGLTGLYLAWRLLQKGHIVELFESKPYIGGHAAAFRFENTYLDCYYHHIFKKDSYLINVIEELDLENKLRWYDSKMGFFVENKFFDFGTPVSLLTFSPFNVLDKIRFGISILLIQAINNWNSLEYVTAKNWLIKYTGKKVFETIWEPLLKSKFHNLYDQISMAWLWGRVKLRGSSRDKSSFKEKLGYMDDSFGTLINGIADQVIKLGGKITVKDPVYFIRNEKKNILIKTPNRNEFFDTVIFTVQVPEFVKLLHNIPNYANKYIENLRLIKYTGAVCLVLILKQRFIKYYWLNIGYQNQQFPFSGIVEHTNLVGTDKYNGKNVIYIPNYLFTDDPLYKLSVNDLVKIYYQYLKMINQDFNLDWIEKAYVFRSKWAQPVVTCNYSTIKPDFVTPFPNIFLINMAHIYPEDRGLNYAVKVADIFLKDFLPG